MISFLSRILFTQVDPKFELRMTSLSFDVFCILKLLKYYDIDFTVSEDPCYNFPYLHTVRLYIDDKEYITGAYTILKYFARFLKLYPTQNIIATAHIDEWIDLCTDFQQRLGSDIDENVILNVLSTLDCELENSEWLGNFKSITFADYYWTFTLERLKTQYDVNIAQFEYLNMHFIRVSALLESGTSEISDDE